MNPGIATSVSDALAEGWYKLLLPYEYEPGRFYWCTSAIFLVYFAQKVLGGGGHLALFYSLFVATTYWCSLRITRSRTFAALTAFMFAFGTQLDYTYTFGNLVALYLILTYVAVSFTLLLEYLQGEADEWRCLTYFAVALLVTAVSNEMWINYATGLICALGFGAIWSRQHSEAEMGRKCLRALAVVFAVLALYLLVRLQVASQYVQPGAEEELIVTYKRWSLLIDDAITNFFTLLFMSISNYLPSFLTSSNSLNWLSPAEIAAEQHNYHAEYVQLVVMNHLFMWRFYAGMFVTLFLLAVGYAAFRAWTVKSFEAALVVALALMIIGGFSTHLSIKMRPYNAAPHLPYKVIMSVTAWTVLIAYVTCRFAESVSETGRRAILVGVYCTVLLAAFTRPGMHQRSLSLTGLAGFADPMPKLMRVLGK